MPSKELALTNKDYGKVDMSINKCRKTIIHIITHDKFTKGYIKFFKKYFLDYNHYFLVNEYSATIGASLWEEENFDFENVVRYCRYGDLAQDTKIQELLEKADKIIVTGIFGVEEAVYFLPREIKNKMYWQFWGGDYLKYDETRITLTPAEKEKKNRFKSCLEEIKGCIFLTPFEYKEFFRIFEIEKEKYVAPVPGDPDSFRDDYSEFNCSLDDSFLRIVAGNSATMDNNHEKIFESIHKFCKENILIYCPLSYGKADYKEQVIALGKDMFGEKFIPVTEWMELDDYYHLLGMMDVGIFAMKRQQGMGNIFSMLMMGKKVFLDSDGINYKHFSDSFICYKTQDLENMDYKNFSYTDHELLQNNVSAGKKINQMKNKILKWEVVLN